MKIGVKTYSDVELLKHFEDKTDFFEIMALEKPNQEVIEFIKKTKVPIVIHSQHKVFGINNADKSRYDKNLESLKVAIDLANQTNSNKIIVHPGEVDKNDKDNSSEKNSEDLIKSLNDKRIIIENMPYYNGSPLCSKPKDMKRYLKNTKTKMCFDVNHAISSALSLKENYLEIMKEFIKLKPVHYHLGGQKIKEKDITHLHFDESEINLQEIIKTLPKNAEITLEVGIDIKKTDDDLELIRKIVKELKKD